jgi:hypothetical protein
MVVNPPLSFININTMNAGIWGLGSDITILELKKPLTMKAFINDDGTASGIFSGVNELVNQIKDIDYDALAIHSPIECDEMVSDNYWKNGGVNPWGGIEAIVSKEISNRINKPVAHAPSETEFHNLYSKIVVEKTMAPEIISNTYMFCVLKGLHRSPKLELNINLKHKNILSKSDIDFLITPYGCFGRPHKACIKNDIPIIVVRENTTCFSENFIYPEYKNLIFVDNYLEVAGLIMAMTSGVDYKTILLDK